MTEHFDESDIARQAKEWTKEDIIEVIKSWQMADEFFQEEHIGISNLKNQVKGSRESLAIIIEFINTRCID